MPETDLCQYWPRWFREILDFQALCRTVGDELRLMASAMERVRQNLFVQTMDEDTAAAWEAIFHIVPNRTTETLAFRRDRVLNRLSMRPPFTLTFLYQRLDALFGPGSWEVEVDYPNYTLYIEAAVEDQQYFSEMSVTMDIIKPCHIVYISRPRVSAGLLISEVVALPPGRQYNYVFGRWSLGERPFADIDRRFNYRMGRWALDGALPFSQTKEEELIKMAAQPSIQPALLNQTAGFVAEDIRAVRLNGELVIGTLSRSTVGNVASVGYRVLREQLEEVALIELLDASGNVLTESRVSVPIADETVAFRHAFIVKEDA